MELRCQSLSFWTWITSFVAKDFSFLPSSFILTGTVGVLSHEIEKAANPRNNTFAWDLPKTNNKHRISDRIAINEKDTAPDDMAHGMHHRINNTRTADDGNEGKTAVTTNILLAQLLSTF